MKRVWSLILCLTMALSLCACGKEAETEIVMEVRASAYVMNVSEDEWDDNYTGISEAGLKASRMLVKEYIALINSNRVLEETIEQYSQRGVKHVPDLEELRAALTMKAVDKTALLSVTITAFHEDVTADELLWLCEDLLTVSAAMVPMFMDGLTHMDIVDAPAIYHVETYV